MKKELYLLFTIIILIIFSLVVFPGYKVFMYDQSVYIPGIYQSLNIALFQNDFLSNFNINAYTLFDELMIFFIKFLNMDLFSSFFFLTVVLKFIYFYSIYRISLYFTDDERFSVFSMLLFIISSVVYGTASWTWDINILPRVISLPVNLLFLAYFLNNRHFLSTLPLGIGLLTHPITFLPFIIFFYINLIFPPDNKKRFPRKSALLTGIMPFLFLMFHLFNNESGLKLNGVIDPVWEDIIIEKTPFVFIKFWNYKHLLFMLVSICFFIFMYLESSYIFDNKIKRRYLIMLFLIPLSLFVVSFITVDVLKREFLMQLSLPRGLVLWKIFIPLFFMYYTYRHIKTSPRDFIYNFLLIGTLLSFIFYNICIFLFLPIFLFLWMRRRYNLFNLNRIKVLNKEWPFGIIFLVLIIGLLLRYMLKNNIESVSYLLGIILFSIFTSLICAWEKDFPLFKLTGILFIVMMVCIIVFIPGFSIHPLYFNDRAFMEACEWIRNKTPKHSVFITEPFSKKSIPIRATCYRDIFVSGTDGGLVYYKRDYALEWEKRMDLINELRENHGFLSEVFKKYKVDYIFSDTILYIDYPVVFHNKKYFIYKLL